MEYVVSISNYPNVSMGKHFTFKSFIDAVDCYTNYAFREGHVVLFSVNELTGEYKIIREYSCVKESTYEHSSVVVTITKE